MEHADPLSEHVVDACGDLLQCAVAFRLLECHQQFLSRADHGVQRGILRLEFLRDGIQLRHTGGRHLPACEPSREMYALYEPCISCGEAKEEGVRLHAFFCHGRCVKCSESLPKHSGVSILPPEQPIHKHQHRDVHEYGRVIRTCQENAVRQEIEPLADGGDGHFSGAQCACMSEEEQQPPCEQGEDADGRGRQEAVEVRQGAYACCREQGTAPWRPPHGEDAGAYGSDTRRHPLVGDPVLRRQPHEVEPPAAAEKQREAEDDGERRHLRQTPADAVAVEAGCPPTERSGLGDENEEREEHEDDDFIEAGGGQSFHGRASLLCVCCIGVDACSSCTVTAYVVPAGHTVSASA